MKTRSAFTLVELIFVLVVIGILAAVAVPKFKNLKQTAEVRGVIKTTVDAAQLTVETALNQKDLEKNSSVELSDLIKLKGKGWHYVTNASSTDTNGTYYYADPLNDKNVSEIKFYNEKRTVEYIIRCGNFNDAISQTKCYDELNLSTGQNLDINLTF